MTLHRAYTLIVAVAMVPCIAVLWHQDALGTLLAAGILLAIGTWLPSRPVRRIHRAAVRPVQVRESYTRRVQHERASDTGGGPRHLGGTTARGFLSKA